MSIGGSYNESQQQATSSGRTGGYTESGGLTLSRGQGSSSGSTSSFSSSTPGFMTELGTILDRNLKGEGPYSKSAAIADSQGVLRTNAQDALQQSLPAIYRPARASGAYNSTTETMLQNDLASRIVAQGEATQLDAISKYGTLGNQQIAAFSGATQAGTTQAGGSSGSNSSSQTQDSIGLNASLGVQEGVNQSQSSGDSFGVSANVGFGGAADGGVLGTWEDVSPHSLVSAGDSVFTLIPNFLGPDGTGKKTGNLSILPQLMASLGMELGVPAGATSERGPKDGEKPAAPAMSGGSTGISKGAQEFLDTNGFKSIEEATLALNGKDMWSIKDLYKTADIDELGPAGAKARQQVMGWRDPGESTGGYADGGTIVDETQAKQGLAAQILAMILGSGSAGGGGLMTQTNRAREVNAGLEEPNAAGQGGIVINVNGGGGAASGNRAPGTAVQQQRQIGFADGGVIDSGNLQRAIMQFASGGQVPHLNSVTDRSGKIGGPQSMSGQDNQLVKVAGGEGVIPVDVMQQPGVADMLQQLIKTYHKPVNQ